VRLKSVFCFDCLCGRHIETETRTLTCPSCHRELVVEWGREEERDSEPERLPEVVSLQSAA